MVVNYGDTEQQSLLKRMFKGFMPASGDLLRISLVLGVLIALLMGAINLYLWYKRSGGRYANVEKIYILWLSILALLSGLKREMSETPNAFLKRVKRSKYRRLAKVTENLTVKLEQDYYQQNE